MREEVLAKLAEEAANIWAVSPEDITEDKAIADFNPKSIQYTKLTTTLENEFDVEISFFDFKKCETFGDAADYVTELLEE